MDILKYLFVYNINIIIEINKFIVTTFISPISDLNYSIIKGVTK